MKRRPFPLVAAGLLTLILAAYSSRAEPEAACPGPTLDQIVSARKAAMAMSLFALGDLKRRVESGAPASEQSFIARSFANWAKAVPGMFPPGTAGSDEPFANHAKPEIWTQWPAFQRCAADYIESTGKLVALATAGNDPEGVKKQIDLVRRSCNSCHEAFRYDPHAGPGRPRASR